MVAAPVARFVALGVAAFVIVGLAVSVASQRVGQREATVEARSTALATAQGVVEPALTDGLLTGDEASIAALDEVVRKQVLDDSLVRVKVWSADGEVLYSDEPRAIGEEYVLGEDEEETLRLNQAQAEVSDLTRPENRYERRFDKLLEVYLPVTTPDGTKVLFEAYFKFDSVNESGQRIWRSFAPITLGALFVLLIVQIPLAWSLARQLRTRQLERERLLNQAIGASEIERRRIAQDIHDGVVQDLAGVSYSFAAIARQDRPPTPEELAAAGDTVRASVEALRTLLVEIYPPNLAEEGLGPAISDLLARASASGLTTELDIAALAPDLPTAQAALVYRVIQEALRNVSTHARAQAVTVSAGSTSSQIWAEITDDGVGFDPSALKASAEAGHFGLTGLRDLVADAGGRLTVTSVPDEGTTIRVEVALT